MKFLDLARYFEKIEATPSRNQMMEIIAQLLKTASHDEIDQLVYLSLGGLAPKFNRIEFNLADKMVIRAISKATKQSKETVTKNFKSTGDLGQVFQSLSTHTSSNLSIQNVYTKLLATAKDEGQGSQDRKTSTLSELLSSVDKLSGRYIVRIVLGKLRLGFSDKTILDALSFMEHGTKEGRDDLDWAYQVYPDVGRLAKLVKQYGIKNSRSKVSVKLGVPVMPALAQRLKTSKEMIAKMGRVIAEPKFDGTRVQIHFDRNQALEVRSKQQDQLFTDLNIESSYWVKSFTRNLDESSHMFPELQQIGNQLSAESVILDSEAVGYDPQSGKMLPFQMTITRKRKHGIKEAISQVPLKFYVFDILYKNGQSLIQLPLKKRRDILTKTIQSSDGPLIIDDYLITDSPNQLKSYHHHQLEQGLEGAMVKKIDGPYTPGRLGWNWVKFKEAEGSQAKLSDTLDCVVMGYYRGQGKRSQFGIGAFLVGIRSGSHYLTIAKIGTGLTDEQWREIILRVKNHKSEIKPKQYSDISKILTPDVWVHPHLVVEIAADEITKSPSHSAGFALRFPRLIKFRDDKEPNQVTSIAELKSIKN